MKSLTTIKKQSLTTAYTEIQQYFKLDNDIVITDSDCIKLAINMLVTRELSTALKNNNIVVVSDINYKYAKHKDLIDSAKHITLLATSDSTSRTMQIDFAQHDTFNIVTSLRVVDKLRESDVACYLTDNKYAHKLKSVNYDNLISVLKTCLSIMQCDDNK